MECTIREASTGDGDGIRDVQNASIRGLGDQIYDEEQVEAWGHPRNSEEYPIRTEDTYFLVAEQNEQVVGFGWMKPDADDYFQKAVEGEITATYIHPSVAREGVGSAIYENLEKFARQQRITSLGLWASLNAVSFYQAHGYSHVTDQTLEYPDGIELPVVEMRKELI